MMKIIASPILPSLGLKWEHILRIFLCFLNKTTFQNYQCIFICVWMHKMFIYIERKKERIRNSSLLSQFLNFSLVLPIWVRLTNLFLLVSTFSVIGNKHIWPQPDFYMYTWIPNSGLPGFRSSIYTFTTSSETLIIHASISAP